MTGLTVRVVMWSKEVMWSKHVMWGIIGYVSKYVMRSLNTVGHNDLIWSEAVVWSNTGDVK